MGQERLQKYLARAGVASRRSSEKLIVAGRVTVGGRTVYRLGEKVDPDRDRVTVDGKVVSKETFVYFAFYKPRGILTTLSDPRGRMTISSFIPRDKERIYPVGRLDRDSEGLLLLTNDGDLAARLLHPRYHVEKEYEVNVSGALKMSDLEPFQKGILLDGRPRQAVVHSLHSFSSFTKVCLTIKEGRKRQIRRMFEAIGKEVLRPKRIRMGPISLGTLKPGKIRALSTPELKRIKEHAK